MKRKKVLLVGVLAIMAFSMSSMLLAQPAAAQTGGWTAYDSRVYYVLPYFQPAATYVTGSSATDDYYDSRSGQWITTRLYNVNFEFWWQVLYEMAYIPPAFFPTSRGIITSYQWTWSVDSNKRGNLFYMANGPIYGTWTPSTVFTGITYTAGYTWTPSNPITLQKYEFISVTVTAHVTGYVDSWISGGSFDWYLYARVIMAGPNNIM